MSTIRIKQKAQYRNVADEKKQKKKKQKQQKTLWYIDDIETIAVAFVESRWSGSAWKFGIISFV